MELRSWPALDGAGALRSTLDDMLKYLAFHMGLIETPLRTLLPLIETPYFGPVKAPGSAVGLAWQMHPLRRSSPLTVVAKNGGTAGFHSFVAFVKETGTGVVVLSNSEVRNEQVGLRILGALNPGREKTEEPDEGHYGNN
jgi:CubicO group peptidase (beta-lactamase class C family)